MKRWIDARIERANWRGFLVWFAVLFAFSFWAFSMDSPWTRALEAAGGALPETQPGLPAIEPQRSLAQLGDATGDYLLWQLLDIPYALMNLMAASLGMALGLKAVRLQSTPLRWLLILPVMYAVCELVENSLVALFASGALTPGEPLVLSQQAATTLKFAAGMPSLALGAAGAAIAGAAGLIRLAR